MNELTHTLKRDYRAVSMALASAVLGVLLMRVILYFSPFDTSTAEGDLAYRATFAIPVQILFFLVLPFCAYKFYGKRTFLQTLEYSSVKGFRAYHLLAVPLGVCAFIISLAVSSLWSALLRATGYVYSGTSVYPASHVAGYFVCEVLLTAVLPAVCEEFVMRGGFITTAKTRFTVLGCVILGGIAFGLFHQNIRQVFYTALFGAFAVYLTVTHKSIFPAMIMHFVNNFCSVYIDYATHFDWAVLGGFYDVIEQMGQKSFMLNALCFTVFAAGAVGLTVVMGFLRERRVIANKKRVLKDSAFDATKKRVVLMGEFDEKKVEELEMEREVFGADYYEQKYRPALRDVMYIIALGAVTLLTTVFSYVWGFL